MLKYLQDEPPARRPSKKRSRRPQNRHRESDDDDFESPPPREKAAPVAHASPTEEVPLPTKTNKAVFEKPRVVPRIRPPVPLSEREKYARPGEDATTEKPSRSNKRPTTEYEDEEEEAPPRKNKKQQQDVADEDDADFRRMPAQGANGRPLRRNRGPSSSSSSRRRPSRPHYDDDEEDYREEARPMRKRPSRRPYADEYDDEPAPAPRSRKPARQRQREYDDDYEEDRERRPAKKSTTTTTTTTTTTPRPTTTTKKPKSTTIAYDDEEYYEDEYEDEAPAAKKPQKVAEEPATSASTQITTTTTAASTSSTTTTRRPFVPKPKAATPPPDTSMKFKLITGAEKEDAFEFSIDDYVKPTTRAPFIPRGSKAPGPSTSTTSTTTAAPKTRESVRQPAIIKSREPVEEAAEDDYDYNIKPVRIPQQSQFQSRNPTKSPVEVISSRAPIPPRNKPAAVDYSAEVEQKPPVPRFPARVKTDFTSAGVDDEYRTIVSRKPEAKQPVPEYKTPSPPPRSRLPTSFLPRGLSPVGGARTKATTAAPLYEDEEDEAFNDALHPTGADSSSTLRYSTLTQPQNRLPPIRGSQQRLQAEQPEVSSPAQSGFSRLPLYDDEDVVDEQPTAPASRTGGQFQSRQVVPPASSFDSYQGRQQAATSSSSSSNSFRGRQPQSQQRGRPLATAASTAQYQGWSRDYFYPTYWLMWYRCVCK